MMTRALAMSSLLLLGACANGRPESIAYDSDTCARCHMQISERQFSAVLVTRRGRSMKFDSIDCLRAYVALPGNDADVASIWVADFAHPGIMIAAERAKYYDLGVGRSPMGESHGWAAVAGPVAATKILGVDSTLLRAWTDLP